MTSREAALIAAAVRRFGARAPALLARLGVSVSPVDERDWCAEVPEEMDRIHPSWTGRLPPAAEAGPAVRRWLRRAHWGMLVSMPKMGLAARDPADLIRALETLGRGRLALALRAAPPAAAIEIAGRLGDHGKALLAEVNEATMPAKGAVRTAVGELSDVLTEPSKGDQLLFVAGVRHVAPLIVEVGGDLGKQLAQRMPRAHGEILLREIARAEAQGAKPSTDPDVPRIRLERLL